MHIPLTVSFFLGLNGLIGKFHFNQTSLNQLNQFGFDLLKTSDEPIVSAFGLANALAMCSAGAAGATEQILQDKLAILEELGNTNIQVSNLI
jgi:hypothetical protein